MLKDWQNRGVLLWSTSVSSLTVTASTTAYDLASSTIDALEVVLNRDNTDIQLERVSPEEYLLIPNKTQTGRPSQYSIRRKRDNPVISLWPIPENSTDVLKIETISELQDVNKSATSEVKALFRILPSEGEDDIKNLPFTFFNTTGVPDSGVATNAQDIDDFVEYKYTAGINDFGAGVELQDFQQFQIKLVLQGTNSASVPRLMNLRAIALAT